MPTTRFECDQCGACCRHLIVEADAVDVLRQPALIEADEYYRGKTVHDVIDLLEDGRVVNVACGGCHFLAGNRCSIYSTRPSACVAMQAGDDQCQECRVREGLPPLQPSNG